MLPFEDVPRVHHVVCSTQWTALEALVLDPDAELLENGGGDLLGERVDLLLGEEVGVPLDDGGLGRSVDVQHSSPVGGPTIGGTVRSRAEKCLSDLRVEVQLHVLAVGVLLLQRGIGVQNSASGHIVAVLVNRLTLLHGLQMLRPFMRSTPEAGCGMLHRSVHVLLAFLGVELD